MALLTSQSLSHLGYSGSTSSRLSPHPENRDHCPGDFLPSPPSSLSQFQLHEGRSPLERGKDRPCHFQGQLPFGGEQNLMSQRPYASNSPSDETSQPVSQLLTSTSRSAPTQDEVETVDPQVQHGAQGHPPNRSGSMRGDEILPELAHTRRPTSSSQNVAPQQRSRSLGMQAILNPSTHSPTEPISRQGSREPLGSPTSTATSPSALIHGTPSPVQPPAQPTRHYHYETFNMSPRVERRMLTPKSPAVRAASLGSGRYPPVPGTINAMQSPFLQSPPPPRFAEGAPRLNVDSASSTVPSRLTQPRRTTHAANIFYDQRPPNNPQSQETSPRTPQSSYSSFSQASPAPVPPAHIQQQHQHPAPISNPAMSGSSRSAIAQSLFGDRTGDPANVPPWSIPLVLDTDSGSIKAKIKREKNSSASKRFRQRKKAVEEEQMQTIRRQEEEIRSLTEERDFYLRERNFFRDMYSRTPGAQIPQRPPSPRTFKSRATSLASDEGERTSVDPDDRGRGTGGRNVRQRTGAGPIHLPYPGSQTPSPFVPTSTISPSTQTPPAPSYPLSYPSTWRAPSVNTTSQPGDVTSTTSPAAQTSPHESQQQQQGPPFPHPQQQHQHEQ